MKQIQCHHCHGKGLIELPEHLRDVLAAMGSAEMGAEEINNRLESATSVNAISNRLRHLKKLGFVKFKRKVGKVKIYQRTS
jgi:hypothetical protein